MNHPTTEISTTDAPQPAGAYAQARRIGPFLQISGQLGIDGDDTSIEGQTRKALAHVTAILNASSASWSEVLSIRAYLSDDALFDRFDAAYRAELTSPFPARTTVSCELAPGALVEIDALAVLLD